MKPDHVTYKKILLKISGEALMGKGSDPYDASFLEFLADEIVEIYRLGVMIGIVAGGGNIFRGLSGTQCGVERIAGDYMGMLATLINSLALSSVLKSRGCPTQILSPFPISQIADISSSLNARQAMEDGLIVLFSGGTGNPFFTTDSAAVLRALEAGCQVVLKATKVDGIYDCDPVQNPKATFIPHMTYEEALSRDIRVMDQTAFSLCRENNLPIKVFNITKKGNIRRAVTGEGVGSLVDDGS